MRILFFLLALTTLPRTSVRAQHFPPETYAQLSDSMGAALFGLDSLDFYPLKTSVNDYLTEHLALYSKREKLEVRVYLKPRVERSPLGGLPHLRAHTLAMNLGSNDEDAVTAVHSFDGDELAALNADWARMWTFRPKRSFSDRAHAQLVAIYRADRGLAFLVLLFDKAPGTIEDRQLALRFE